MRNPKRSIDRSNMNEDDTEFGFSKETPELILQIYFDETQPALNTMKVDRQQVAMADERTGITPLHISIFRQNFEVTRALLNDRRVDFSTCDKHGRSPLDMLDYSSDTEFHQLVLSVVFADADRRVLDEIYDAARADGTVKPFGPKPR